MNPQDRIEQVLREIHLVFSDAEPVPSSEDRVIVNRKKMLDLLERLNEAVDGLLQSEEAGNEAELAAKKRGEQMMEKAQARAEDIYAASLLYSDDMVGKLRNLLDEANDSVNDMIRGFRRELHKGRDLLQTHETQLHAQLAELSDTGKYLQVIEQINREREQENSELDEERKKGQEFASHLRASSVDRIYVPASSPKITGDEYGHEKAEETEPDDIIDFDLEEPGQEKTKPEIKVNKDAAYFKWRREQEIKEKSPSVNSKENPAASENIHSGDSSGTEETISDSASDERAEKQDFLFSGKDSRTGNGSDALSKTVDPMTGKLPNEDALMKAMLVGETSDVETGAAIASPLAEEHLVKEVQVPDMDFDWKDMDLSSDENTGGRETAHGLYGDAPDKNDAEPPVRQKKKKGKFKDFLLGN